MNFTGDSRAARTAHVSAEIRALCPWMAPHEAARWARAFVVGEGSA
jgi:hypothetical protein